MDSTMLALIVGLILIPSLVNNSQQQSTQPTTITTPSSSNNRQEIFTFNQDNSFLLINSTDVWPPSVTRTLNFQFRTDRPNALLFFHTVDSGPQGYPLYEFYMVLHRGALEIIHEFGSSSDRFTIGKGFNDDQWHLVNLTIHADEAKLKIIIDGQIGSIFILRSFLSTYANLYAPYPSNGTHNVPSLLFFGGLDPDRRLVHKHHNSPRFIGCLGHINFIHERILFVDSPVIRSAGLQKGCTNLCRTGLICSLGSPCVNHYTHAKCDCFGTDYEDDWCTSSPVSAFTFRGSSFITHKAFNWTERSETLFNRISLHFRTQFDNSMLLYAYGLYPDFNHIHIALVEGILRFEIDFGEGPLRVVTAGPRRSFFGGNAGAGGGSTKLSDDNWHNVTVLHKRREVFIILDGQVHRIKVAGQRYYLHLEPYVYIAGLPASIEFRSNFQKDLMKSKFVGCLKSVYFNEDNILYSLSKKDPKVRYTGLFPPEPGCLPVSSLPITFQTSRSYLNVTKKFSNILDVFLEFKTDQTNVVLSSGKFHFLESESKFSDHLWILHLKEGVPHFSIIDADGAEVRPISKTWSQGRPVRFIPGQWQMIGLYGQSSNLTVDVNNVHSVKYEFDGEMSFDRNIIVGALNVTFPNSTRFGYGIMGCIRKLGVDHQSVDSRVLLNDPSLHSGRVSLDQCKIINPCDYPGACEHGGKCTVNREGDADCDCTDTGYAGKTCHFALYKRTCEEYYLIGHRKNGTYMIDIDRNGPLPPARVECTMSVHGTATTVLHNLPVEYIVRKKNFPNYYINIEYREFNDEMLRALIGHTKGCTQEIKYGCKKAPLRLAKDTWMVSASNRRVDGLGNEMSGRCACSTAMTCLDRNLFCNCDSSSNLENEDSGVISEPSRLAITRAFFLQPKNLTKDSEGRFTLSPLKCIDLSTQEHNITFKTSDSYLELDGWTEGDLAFSFRTTLANGIILYQAPLFPHHGYFMVSVVSEFEILFEYSVNGVPRQSKLISRRKLNDGRWQQVWVDYETRHMRFTVNLDSLMIDLDVGEQFDLFEGPLYIGGAPKSKLKDRSIKGFIGCFRGLLIQDRIIPLIIPEGVTNIEPRCQESCNPNPCQNGGYCIEMWGNYDCRCANPYAHSGKNCEIDANSNGITVSSDDAFVHMLINGPLTHPVLHKSIAMSFRTYEDKGLLLYANDHLNNFIMLHIDKSLLLFTFNSLRKIVKGQVTLGPELVSGRTIQVTIDRRPEVTILTVFTGCDKNCTKAASTVIQAPLSLLQTYYQWPWREGSRLELIRPIRAFIALPSHTQFFIGGVDPIVQHSVPTFIGCITGLLIDGTLFDLETMIKAKNETESNHLSVTGDVASGCQRICDSKPCENGGQCWENMRIKSIKGVTCQCNATSYRGEFCEQDIGVRFDGSSVLTYNITDFPARSSDGIRLEFAFSAEPEAYPFLSGIRRLLLLFQKATWTLLVSLQSSGGIYLQEDDGLGNGWRKTIQRRQHHFADGFRHWVVYVRKNDTARLEIDGVSHDMMFRSHIVNVESIKPNHTIKVGGSLDREDNLTDYKTYIGCVSNLRIKFGSNLEHTINPIESAFEGDVNVDVTMNGSHIWQGIKQQRCSRFKPISKTGQAQIIPPYEFPEVKWTPSETIKHQLPNVKSRKSPVDPNNDEFYIFVGCLSFLAIVITSVVIYMCKLQRSYKVNKFRGETPFFNSQRKNSPSIPYTRVNQSSPTSFDKRPSVPRLVHYKPEGKSKMTELHPLQETSEEYDRDTEELAPINSLANHNGNELL